MDRAGPSRAGRHATNGRTATSAALRPIRKGHPATLSEASASARTECGADTKGGRLRADPPVDLCGLTAAAPARVRERVDPAVGARDRARAGVRRARRARGQSWTTDDAAPRGIAPPGIERRRTGRCDGLLGSAGCAQALASQFGSGREPRLRARQRTRLALQRGARDGVGPDFWAVTGLVVFAPTPDDDCPGDRRRRK